MIRLGSRSKSTEVVADGHADMPKKLLLVNSGQIGRMKHGPLRSLSSLRFFPPFPPCYHALNSCFLRKFGSLSGCPQAAANSELPCPHFSAGERKLKYPGPGFGYNQESAVQIEPIYFLFFSVPQCLRGAKVLSLVAASSRRVSGLLLFFFDTCQGQSPKLWPHSPVCYACEESADTPLSHARYSPES